MHLYTCTRNTCWNTCIHTQCALDVSQCRCFVYIAEDFQHNIVEEKIKKKTTGMSVVSTKWESIWGWNAFVQPLIKKVQTFPLSCLILCRLLLDWGRGGGLYLLLYFSSHVPRRVRFDSWKKKAPYMLSDFVLYPARLSRAACSSVCGGKLWFVILLCTYTILSLCIWKLFPPLRSSSGWYWLQ